MRNLLWCVALAGTVGALACTKDASPPGGERTGAGGEKAAPAADAGDAEGGVGGSSPVSPTDAAAAHGGEGGNASGTSGSSGASGAADAGAVDSGAPVDAGDAGGSELSADASIGSGDTVGCLEGGDEIDSDATGACDDPVLVDLRDADFGDVFVHFTREDATNGLPEGIGKCAATTERDVVYRVRLPNEGDLELSVDADDDADPIILVQSGSDPTCATSSTFECVDDYGAGTCEYLRVLVSNQDFDDDEARIVIAESVASGRALRVRFRVADPSGGS